MQELATAFQPRNAYRALGRCGERATRLGDDLGGDAADAGAGEADGARSARREVEDAAANERAAVIDGDDDAAAAMGDPQLGAERQRAVAAVMAFWLKRWPEAVLLPDSLP